MVGPVLAAPLSPAMAPALRLSWRESVQQRPPSLRVDAGSLVIRRLLLIRASLA